MAEKTGVDNFSVTKPRLKRISDNLQGDETHLFDPFIQAASLICLQQMIELIYYPFDTWKTYLQYKSIYGIDNANGLQNLFRGLLITMLTSTPLIYTFYLVCIGVPLKYFFENYFVFIGITGVLVISFIATNITIVPRELVKILIQLNKTPLTPINIIREIKHKDGLKNGVFRGFWITFTVNTIDLLHNTLLARVVILERFAELTINVWSIVCFLVVLVILTPLDLAKTAIQIHETVAVDIETCDDIGYRQLSKLSCITEINRSNPFKILWCVHQKRGFIGLYAGFLPLLVRMVLIAAILVVYILMTRDWYWDSNLSICWIKQRLF